MKLKLKLNLNPKQERAKVKTIYWLKIVTFVLVVQICSAFFQNRGDVAKKWLIASPIYIIIVALLAFFISYGYYSYKELNKPS